MANPNKGVDGKLVIQGSTAGYITSASIDLGNQNDEITALQDSNKKYMKTIEDAKLAVSGFMDTTDTTLALMRTAALAAEATISGVVYYTGSASYYTFPATAIIDGWSESNKAGGAVEWSCNILANGAVSYTNA